MSLRQITDIFLLAFIPGETQIPEIQTDRQRFSDTPLSKF